MIVYVENSARPETWARDTGMTCYHLLVCKVTLL